MERAQLSPSAVRGQPGAVNDKHRLAHLRHYRARHLVQPRRVLQGWLCVHILCELRDRLHAHRSGRVEDRGELVQIRGRAQDDLLEQLATGDTGPVPRNQAAAGQQPLLLWSVNSLSKRVVRILGDVDNDTFEELLWYLSGCS